MCRYTDTEAVDGLPIAFLHRDTLEALREGVDRNVLSLSDIVKQVQLWRRSVFAFVHHPRYPRSRLTG
jgi:hypothetical protein